VTVLFREIIFKTFILHKCDNNVMFRLVLRVLYFSALYEKYVTEVTGHYNMTTFLILSFFR